MNRISQADYERIAAELDAAHSRAREGYLLRDAGECMRMFRSDLAYRRLDGETNDYETLARDVRVQLGRMVRASTEFTRESLEIGEGGVTAVEVLEQHATYEVRIFGVLHREWRIQRRGRYEWAWADAGWQVTRAEVLAETVDAPRTWLALR